MSVKGEPLVYPPDPIVVTQKHMLRFSIGVVDQDIYQGQPEQVLERYLTFGSGFDEKLQRSDPVLARSHYGRRDELPAKQLVEKPAPYLTAVERA
jgi:hypothetical protein